MLSKAIVESQEIKLIQGIISSDIDLLDTLLHEDLLFMTPDGSVLTKEMDIKSHKSGTMSVEHLIPEFEDFRLIEDTAISTMVYTTEGSMLGVPIKGRFRYIRFWKAFDDEIKVIGGSCFQIE